MTAGPYYVFATLQSIDGRIAAGDQTTADAHGLAVDQEIENWLTPYTASLPFASPEIIADIKAAAAYEALARTLLSIFHDYKAAEFWSKKYNENKTSIIERLKISDTGAKNIPGVASNAGPHMKGGRT